MMPVVFRLLVAVAFVGQAWGQFSIQYTDGAGTGFFDATARSPIGGNTGTTLGEQRRISLEEAVAKWEEFLQPAGPVVVEAGFANLGAGTLAQTGVGSAHIDFAGALEADTWYVGSLANHLSGQDLSAGDNEILLTANNQIDAGSGYYYGLDGQGSILQVDFYATMLHEIGHGLGVFSLVDPQNGSEFGGSTDAFSRNLLDIIRGETWDQMTNAERASSAIGGISLVWNGRGSQLATESLVVSGNQLGRVTYTEAGNPETILPAGTAAFGPSLSEVGITGELVLVDDGVVPTADACEEPFVNAAALVGKIALIDRGTCFFTEKIKRAQDAGAIAVIVADNGPNRLIVMGGSDGTITIPGLFVSQQAGVELRALSAGTMVTLKVTDLNGTWDDKALMYTPTTVELGSSVSHWDTGFEPSFLLEPFAAETGRDDPDLAITLMRDIGWTVKDVPFPNLDYELWEELNVTGTTGRGSDSDGDGADNFSEYAFGTDPEDEGSFPGMVSIDTSSGDAEVTFRRTDQAVDLEFDVTESTDLTGFSGTGTTTGATVDAGSEVVDETRNMGATSGSEFFQIEAREK